MSMNKYSKFNLTFIILIVLALIATAFYWYEWRPSRIREECHRIAESSQGEFSLKDYIEKTKLELIAEKYELCLHEKGLE